MNNYRSLSLTNRSIHILCSLSILMLFFAWTTPFRLHKGVAIHPKNSFEYDSTRLDLQIRLVTQSYMGFCPVVVRSCTPLFSDDFSNPASGWPAEDTGEHLYEYNNGEYRILVRPDQWGAIAHPGFQASDYAVSVNLRNPNGVYGSYGIAFGLVGDFSTFYTLEIFPDGWYGIYRWDPDDIVTLSEAFSPAIQQGSATNSIKVERNGASIKAYANDQLLASVTDGTYTGSRYVGLAVFSYDQPNVDIRFDNFTVSSIDCGTVISASRITDESHASPGERFFDFNLLDRGHIQPQR